MRILITFLTIICVLVGAEMVFALIQVPSEGMETIQAGIDAAEDGDTVLVFHAED